MCYVVLLRVRGCFYIPLIYLQEYFSVSIAFQFAKVYNKFVDIVRFLKVQLPQRTFGGRYTGRGSDIYLHSDRRGVLLRLFSLCIGSGAPYCNILQS